MKRRALLLVAIAIAAASCGRLGVGTPGCPSAAREPGTAIILSLQAVPTAKYAPCVNELKYGWRGPEFSAKSGRAEIRVLARESTFLRVRLTESCDIGSATRVESSFEDVERFEAIEAVSPVIGVGIVPTGEGPLDYARAVLSEHANTVVRDRLVRFRINVAFQGSVRSRVDQAFEENDFVWIVGELDAEEGTLELRQTPEGEGARGLDVAAALQRMEEVAAEIKYQGRWYLRFEGGCITYDFDARGALAATLGEDADAAFGLYPLDGLRAFGAEEGYEVTPVEGG